MKKLASLFLIFTLATLFVACKKDTKITPNVSASKVSTTSQVRIKIETTSSTSIGKLDGYIKLMNDTVQLSYIPFNQSYSLTYTFDTTIVVSAPEINLHAFVFTMKTIGGGLFDYDPIADTYMTVWVDNKQVFDTKNTAIVDNILIKQ